jgi:hypothetical protein
MQPFLLFALSIFLGYSSLAQAKPLGDGGDLFVSAYVKAQQGEKAEQAGHMHLALSKLKKAARMLDEIGKKYPFWSPAIVNYRKECTADAIARVEGEIARSNPSREDKSANGSPAQIRKRIEQLEREPVPKDWGEQFDPGIFMPQENPRGW